MRLDLYTSANIYEIRNLLPQQICQAIENSDMWMKERDAGLQTTQCVSLSFPKGTQSWQGKIDAQFTIVVDIDHAYRLGIALFMRDANFEIAD